MHNNHSKGVSLITAAVSVALSTSAIAQGLEEIVVTAERIETLLHKTPIAISVVGGDEFERLNVKDGVDLSMQVAGLDVSRSSDRSLNRMTLRGKGQGLDTAGVEQAVAQYVDGVYFGNINDNQPHFFDLDRLEVLRGPQGTLFGRNSLSGALNFITRVPTEETEIDLGLSIGNFSTTELDARISGAIGGSDSLFGSVSLNVREQEGWMLNLNTGNKLDGFSDRAIRGKLRWVLDNGEINLSASLFQDDLMGSSGFGQIIGIAAGTGPSWMPAELFDGTYDLRDTTWLLEDGSNDRSAHQVNLNMTFELGAITLDTITAVQENDTDVFSVFFAGPDGGRVHRDVVTDSFQQEIRFSGGSERLNWQAGLFLYEAGNVLNENWIMEDSPTNGTWFFLDRIFFGLGRTDIDVLALTDITTNSQSAFAQATYSPADWLNLTLGTRYTKDEKSGQLGLSGEVPMAFIADEAYLISVSQDFAETTPRLAVDVSFDDVGAFDSVMAYASYSSGFLSGGFQPGVTQEEAETFYNSTTVWNTELGFKGRALDNRLGIEFAVFEADYDDLQQRLPLNPTTLNPVISNIDEIFEGYELTIDAAPWENGNISLSGAFYEGRVKEGSTDQQGNPIDTVYNLPDSEIVLGFRQNIPLGSFGGVGFSATYLVRKGEIHFDGQNEFISDNTDRNILNLEAALQRNNWELALWVRNATDDAYLTNARHPTEQPWGQFHYPRGEYSGRRGPASEVYIGKWGAPRTYGLTFRWSVE